MLLFSDSFSAEQCNNVWGISIKKQWEEKADSEIAYGFYLLAAIQCSSWKMQEKLAAGCRKFTKWYGRKMTDVNLSLHPKCTE